MAKQSVGPSFAQPGTVFTLAGTPVQADASAPLNAIGVFSLCWILVAERYPERDISARAGLTLLWTLLFWAVFCLHSIGHILSARTVGAPMDSLVINAVHWITLYANNNVTPRAHMGRAAGGPLANVAGSMMARLVRLFIPPGPFGRDLVDVFALFSAGLAAAALLPSPSFDGGSLLRWATYDTTGDLGQASLTLQRAGLGASLGLAGLSGVAFILRSRLAGMFLAAFSFVTALDSLRRN